MNFDNYTGSKRGSGVFQNIISTFPKHDIYIECFGGTAAIMKIKDAARYNICFDLNRSVIQKHLDTGLDIYKNDDNSGYYFGVANSLTFLDTSAPILNIIHEIFGIKILIYADPPYPKFTRRSMANIYKHEMTDEQHISFCDTVHNLKCFVVISTYDNQIYKDHLPGWNKKKFNTKTRKGKVTECLYYNFSPEIPLHQYNFLGNNFRDRSAIKGRVLRNLSKINRMPAAERNYLISLLNMTDKTINPP